MLLSIANPSENARSLILDTMDLTIHDVFLQTDGQQFDRASFDVGQRDPILGAPLTIALKRGTRLVRIDYNTSTNAAALQWLEPQQTAGKNLPFMYTQSQTVYARSWIPLQDSPQVRVTYDARIKTPSGLLAVMSADDNDHTTRSGTYTFKMTRPIPSYLIAL
ncbi:MAG: aminopeptidase, partial [Blastocatellia bacterium]